MTKAVWNLQTRDPYNMIGKYVVQDIHRTKSICSCRVGNPKGQNLWNTDYVRIEEQGHIHDYTSPTF